MGLRDKLSRGASSKTTVEVPPPVVAPSVQPVSTQQVLNSEKRNISTAQRGLDREVMNLQREEQKLMVEIKRLSNAGQQQQARTLAKALVQNRNQQQKIVQQKYQLQGVSTNLVNAKATQTMGQTMGSASDALNQINKTMDPQKTMQNVKQYEMQSERMNMAQEMMSDAVDGAMGGDEVDEESDLIMDEILDGIALDWRSKAGVVPATQPQYSRQNNQMESNKNADAELDALLQRLR